MANTRLQDKMAAFKKKCDSARLGQRFYRDWPESLVNIAVEARRAWVAGEITGMTAVDAARFIIEEVTQTAKKNRAKIKIPAVSTVAKWVTTQEAE